MKKLLIKLILQINLEIITAIAVFYGLNNPNKFLTDVSKLLKIMEFSF